jgi:hypothetical protein
MTDRFQSNVEGAPVEPQGPKRFAVHPAYGFAAVGGAATAIRLVAPGLSDFQLNELLLMIA